MNKKNIFKTLSHYWWLVLLLAALLPYLDGLRGEFVFDDIPLIQNDPFYEGSSFTDCWKRSFWRKGMEQGLYRPLVICSYWINVKLAGLYSPAFRAVNLLLHVAVAFLVYKMARRLHTGRIAAILAGIFFAVHPLHSEAVIPASGRAELLCAIFVFAGIFFYSYSVNSLAALAASLLCFIFACWSKEHGIVLFPLCILYDVYMRRISIKDHPKLLESLRNYVLFSFALFLIVYSRILAVGSTLPTMGYFDPHLDNPLSLCPIHLRIVSALRIQGIAIMKFFWPGTLSHDYSYAQLLPSETICDPYAWLTLLLCGGILAALYLFIPKLRRKFLLFSIAYILCIFPAGNFFIFTGTIFAERLYYIPSVWSCLAVSCVLVKCCYIRLPAGWGLRKSSLIFSCMILLFAIVAAGYRTHIRCADWATQESLALTGVKTAPFSAKTWSNLAVQLAKSGQVSEAVIACDHALKIYPDFAKALLNRAFYQIKLKNYKEAERDLRRLVSFHTENPEVYRLLGAILADHGSLTEAKKMWKISLFFDQNQTRLKKALVELDRKIKLKNNYD